MKNISFVFFVFLAPLCSSLLFLSGCSNAPAWKAVPVENLTPLYHQEFAGSGVEVIVRMYAKDIFYITIRNTLANYRLKQIPAASSQTGDIIFPSSKDNNEIAFNFSPKSKTAIEREAQDIIVPWTLVETGDKGFLITHKTIAFDFIGAPGKYQIKSIRILSVADIADKD